MKNFLFLLMLFSLAVEAQEFERLSLTPAEINQNVKAHYRHSYMEGGADIILFKNRRYYYEESGNFGYKAFSEGSWTQYKDTLVLSSTLRKNSLPIKISFRAKDSSDFDVKRVAFLKDLNGNTVSNAFIFINNDSTACMNGDLLCRGEYDSINRIRVEYENWGLSSQWMTVRPFTGLLQVTIQTKQDLGKFLVFDREKYQVLKGRLRSINL